MVLWQYTELFFVTALVFTLFAFYKNTEKIGKIFYFFGGGLMWGMVAWGMWKVTFKWGGSLSVVDYTYIPADEAWMPYAFGTLAILMFILGFVRAIDNAAEPLFGKIVDGL